jgi:uncharacterized protein involved in exopolysaccharide biosynthesis
VINRLLPTIAATQEVRTGVITMRVSAPHPALAKLVAEHLIDEVSRFNVVTRQSQATAERRFTERRLGEVRSSLAAAEEKLQDFLQRNRLYFSSAPLQFEHDRLAREVAFQQSLYSQLATSFESAKIEEVRDTPVLTVINPPDLPTRPDSRSAILRLIAGAFIGLFLGLLVVTALMTVKHWRTADSPALRELRRYAASQDGMVGRLVGWLTA